MRSLIYDGFAHESTSEIVKMKVKRIALPALALSMSIAIVLLINAASISGLQPYSDDPCLPSSEFAVSGLKLYKDESAVKRLLGKPIKVTREKGEDDGGFYTATVFHYAGLRVEVVRGVVDRLYVTSSKVRTPSGVRVGMKYESVVSILGEKPKEIDGIANSYRSCDETQPAFFTLKFSRNQILSSIDIVVDRP